LLLVNELNEAQKWLPYFTTEDVISGHGEVGVLDLKGFMLVLVHPCLL